MAKSANKLDKSIIGKLVRVWLLRGLLIYLGYSFIKDFNIGEYTPSSDINLLALLMLSSLCYLISLTLPALAFYRPAMNGNKESIEYNDGLTLLIYGTMLGWAGALFKGNIGALAAYANYLYFYLLIDHYFSGNGIAESTLSLVATLLMLCIASFTFLYRDHSGEISNPLGDRVSLWGYGVFFWFASMLIVASITFSRLVELPIPNPIIYVLILMLLFIAIKAYQYYKYHYVANSLEQQSYFSKWIMLTTRKLSGIPYKPPPDIDMTENTVIEVDSEICLKDYKTHGFIIPKKFQYLEHFWTVIRVKNHSSLEIAEISTKRSVDYYYSVEKNGALAKLSLLDKHKNIVWQASSRRKGGQISYFPNYERDLYPLFDRLNPPKPHNDDSLKAQVCAQTFKQIRLKKYDAIAHCFIIDDKIFHFPILKKGDTFNYQHWVSKDYTALITHLIEDINYVYIFQRLPDVKLLSLFIWKNEDYSKVKPEQLMLDSDNFEFR